MIKAAGTTATGAPLVILGLSGENMTRLMANEPIMFDLAELGLPRTVVTIVGGRTEDDIRDRLVNAGLLDPATG